MTIPNEILLLISVPLYFGTLVALFKFFGKFGVFMWIILATLFAGIEVLLNVEAFGLTMTLGNVMFGSTFLATDILSERYGKKAANYAVRLGVVTSIIFIVFTQFWLQFTPSSQDFAYDSMYTLFHPVLRISVAGFVVYYICQKIDIIVYHFIWNKTTAKFGDSKKYLWLRNNVGTLTAQFVNNLLFTYFAFATIKIGDHVFLEGMYDRATLWQIFLTGWIIMSVVALLDTPFMYLCRKIKVREIDLD